MERSLWAAIDPNQNPQRMLSFGRFNRRQFREFLVRKNSRVNYKAQPQGNFRRKAGAPTFYYVHGQMRVLPQLELIPGHVEGAIMNAAEQHIASADPKFTKWIAHG